MPTKSHRRSQLRTERGAVTNRLPAQNSVRRARVAQIDRELAELDAALQDYDRRSALASKVAAATSLLANAINGASPLEAEADALVVRGAMDRLLRDNYEAALWVAAWSAREAAQGIVDGTRRKPAKRKRKPAKHSKGSRRWNAEQALRSGGIPAHIVESLSELTPDQITWLLTTEDRP